MTTTRPTALKCIESIRFDKIFEILGFSSEQVEEYVTKFAEEDKEAGEIVRRHITRNINILTLCYIPASCFIIYSSLFKMVKFYAPQSPHLPTRLTDIYKKAVKIFYLRHNEELRNKHFTREDFESDDLPPEEEKKFEKLEKMAFEGIKEGRLIFGGNEVRGMEDSALFHRLPDRELDPFHREEQFCFIHLTMQEFFAAKHLVDNMSKRKLRNFVSKNFKEGKWQLVFQFLAGFIEDKNHPPRKIITNLLPVKTKEKEIAGYYEQWKENKEPRKVTCWPTEDEQDLAVTLIKCLNENSRMKLETQRKLKKLNFNCVNFIACHLTVVDCSSLVNVINVQQLTHLDLSLNNIGPLGCLEICKLLKHSESQLSWLNLTNNQLTAEGAKYLAEAINNNCQLRTLDLSVNNISHIGAQHLAKAINNNNCQLRTLNLTRNNISHIGVQHLAEAIKNNNNCQLRTLNLVENNISYIGAQHMAEAINNNNCQLHTLHLSLNNISHIGVKHLAKALSNENCQLHTLDLSSNSISHLGAQHLAKAINNNNNCQLHTLDLSLNNISDTGAQHLADAINNSQLHTLDLKINNISHIGAQHLAEAINNNNCQLRTLNLSYNNILHIGAQHLAEAINNNNSQLRTLNLRANNTSDIGAQHLAEDISNNNNCQLCTLNLTFNNISEAGKQKAYNLLGNSQSKCKLIL